MIARKYILQGEESFERVQNQGKLVQSESFGLSFFSRKDKKDSKFGFVVSTKISKEAVARNRIKRAMSESIRYLMTEVRPGYDVVLLAKQSALRASTDKIMREVRESLQKAKIIK